MERVGNRDDSVNVKPCFNMDSLCTTTCFVPNVNLFKTDQCVEDVAWQIVCMFKACVCHLQHILCVIISQHCYCFVALLTKTTIVLNKA